MRTGLGRDVATALSGGVWPSDSKNLETFNTPLERDSFASRMDAAFPASTWGLADARRHQGDALLRPSRGRRGFGDAAQEAAV